MKKINLIKNNAFLLLCSVLFLVNGCSDLEDGWADERYLENFGLYVYHTNPLTGEDYTEEELAELNYDPNVKESYAEGQMIELTLVTQKLPSELKILSGKDLSVMESFTEFTATNEEYRSPAFTSTLEDLGLLEIGDKTSVKFDVVYVDGSIGSQTFEIKKVKFFDPNAIVDTFVFLKKSTGETIPLRIDEKVTSRAPNPLYGNIVEFDGVINQVEVTDNAAIAFRHTDDYSIGFWVNTTSDDSDPVMVGDQDWGSSSNSGLTIAHRGNNWRVATADGATKADADNDGAYNDGDWHFLMVTFDRDGNMSMYQDGALSTSTSMAAVGSTDSGNNIHIAQDGTGNYGQFFKGKMGNVYIYDYALSAEQVAGVSTPLTGVKLRTQAGLEKNIPVTNNGAAETTENDRFTFDFNGEDQYATIADTDLGFRYDGDYSISFWINTTSGESDPVMIGDQDWNSSGNPGLTVAFRGSNWRTAYADGTTKADIDHNSGFNDGDWHLLAVTFDRDGDMKMYVDGSEVAKAALSSVGTANSGNPLRLAQDGTGTYGQFFQGKMADTVIYDYALTANQVAALIIE